MLYHLKKTLPVQW